MEEEIVEYNEGKYSENREPLPYLVHFYNLDIISNVFEKKKNLL